MAVFAQPIPKDRQPRPVLRLVPQPEPLMPLKEVVETRGGHNSYWKKIRRQNGVAVEVLHRDLETFEPITIPVQRVNGRKNANFVERTNGEYLLAQETLRNNCLTFSEINDIIYRTIEFVLRMRASLNLPNTPVVDPRKYGKVFTYKLIAGRSETKDKRTYFRYPQISKDGDEARIQILKDGNEKRWEHLVRREDAEILIREEVRKALEFSTVATVRDVAEVSIRTAHNWVVWGRMRGIHCGKEVYVPNRELKAILEERKKTAALQESLRQQHELVSYAKTLERAQMNRSIADENISGKEGHEYFKYETHTDEGEPVTRICPLFRLKNGGWNELFLRKEDADFIIEREDSLDKWFSAEQVANMIETSRRRLYAERQKSETDEVTFGSITQKLRHVVHRERIIYHPQDVLDLVEVIEKLGKYSVRLDKIPDSIILAHHVDTKAGVIRLSESLVTIDTSDERVASEMVTGIVQHGAVIKLLMDNYGLAVPYTTVEGAILVKQEDAELIKRYIMFARGRKESDVIFEDILRRTREGHRLTEMDLATMWIARFMYVTNSSDSRCGRTAWFGTLDKFKLPNKIQTPREDMNRLLARIYEKGFAERYSVPAEAKGELKSSGDAN